MKNRFRFILFLALAVILILTIIMPAAAKPKGDGSILLRGTIVTPDGVIKHGYVLVENGRIVEVSDKQPDVIGAVELNTEGIIYPGLVDIHNHVPWNVLPRWTPPHVYTYYTQWQIDPEYLQKVKIPFTNLEGDRYAPESHICDMNTYGEMRALVGGTTSILTAHSVPCIHGLVRNLDHNSGFYGTTELNLEHILTSPGPPPASQPLARLQFVGLAQYAIANPFYEALFIHLAEGTDAAALEEFTFMQSHGLINPKGAIIHGIPLGSSQFQAMAAGGTSLVWSPVSNIILHGQTADINAALDEGVRIALAPDWGITGSSNILDELHFADQWNQDHLGGRLSDQQLVDMVTSIPAKIAGIDDEVGAIQPGLRADLLVISGDHNNPYRALIEASPEDIQLVMIGGIPVYGGTSPMSTFWNTSDLQQLQVGTTPKALASPAVNFTFADVVTRLQAALEAQGTTLALLVEGR